MIIKKQLVLDQSILTKKHNLKEMFYFSETLGRGYQATLVITPNCFTGQLDVSAAA